MYEAKTMRIGRANNPNHYRDRNFSSHHMRRNVENRMWVQFLIFPYLKMNRWTC